MIDIAARIRELPAYAQLATQLELLAGELAESILRDRLQTLLTGIVEPASAPRQIAAAPPVVVELTTKGKPRARAVIKCSKCGELGKRVDSCGITHNVSTSPAVASVASRGRGNPVSPPATSSLHVKPQAPPHQPSGSFHQDPNGCHRSHRCRSSTPTRIDARSFATCRH